MEWTPLHFRELVRRLDAGWAWRKNGRKLQLIDFEGQAWDFKLQGKPYIRPAEVPKKAPPVQTFGPTPHHS